MNIRRIAASVALAVSVPLGLGVATAPAAHAWYYSTCTIGYPQYCYKVCSPIEEMKGCVSGWVRRTTWYA